jgi:hypothetical protein
VFAFTNSSGCTCKATNALVANRMNLRSGGKQSKMCNPFWTRPTSAEEEKIAQSMVFCEGNMEFDSEGKHSNQPINKDLIGMPKWMKRVLQERGLWVDELTKKQCARIKKQASDKLKSDFEDRVF